MTRKEFVKSLAPFGPLFMLGGFFGEYALLNRFKKKEPEYKPWGHVDMDTPGANHIERVTLDGVELKHVFEFNDVAGWVRHYGVDLEVEDGELRTFHKEGVIRAYLKSETGKKV